MSADNETVIAGGKRVALTNLNKVFWPQLGLTKRDLIAYYDAVSPVLLPHVRGRAMVMKRYPNGISGDFFFMKRAPQGRPDWIETCAIGHRSGNVINFPIVQDRAALLWFINLGCIDLNPWYGPCETPDHPDFLHFDLDPNESPFSAVREAALIVRDALQAMGMTVYVKTSGGKGMHLYVGIKRGPEQHAVWRLAKAISVELARGHKDLLTSEYVKAKRPPNRVLLDYNQNRLGATLASVYSVRPNEFAGVSMPVTWEEVERGIELEDFTMLNALARIEEVGDLWKPLTQGRGRFNLEPLLQ
ncbi:MAG: non-homologous end-joining DNA ligase [Candidatus Baltobacteraceae bacterium]